MPAINLLDCQPHTLAGFSKAVLVQLVKDYECANLVEGSLGKARKQVLISALQKIKTKLESEAMKPEAFRVLEESGLDSLVGFWWNAIETYTFAKYSGETVDPSVPASLAQAIANEGLKRYPHTVHPRSKFRTQLLKGLDSKAERFQGSNTYGQLQETLKLVRTHLSTLTASDGLLKAQIRTDSLNERAESQAQVDVTRAIAYSIKTLQETTAENVLSNWKDVTLALALMTGRRAYAEILGTGTVRAGETEGCVIFGGQAKLKGAALERAEDEYEIPVLCDPDLVVKGWELLNIKREALRKNWGPEIIENPQKLRDKVQSNCTRLLGEYCREWVAKNIRTIGEAKPITPHRLRELYALKACQDFRPDGTFNLKFVANILGHGEKDMTTAISYQLDYELVEGLWP